MAEPFLGEIRITAFNFAPNGWALCNGQLLQIAQNEALYSLLGMMYGGDGQTNFALPDLRNRVPLCCNSTYRQGVTGGEAATVLEISDMPGHQHTIKASTVTNGAVDGPTNAFLTASTTNLAYLKPPTEDLLVPLHEASIAFAGEAQGHENRQPYLVVNFIIALTGIYPERQ